MIPPKVGRLTSSNVHIVVQRGQGAHLYYIMLRLVAVHRTQLVVDLSNT